MNVNLKNLKMPCFRLVLFKRQKYSQFVILNDAFPLGKHYYFIDFFLIPHHEVERRLHRCTAFLGMSNTVNC